MATRMAYDSIYEGAEIEERMGIIVHFTQIAHASQGRTVEREKFVAEGMSWLYALELIPTDRLKLCFKKAIQTSTSDFPLTAGAVKAAWEELKQDILANRAAMTSDQAVLPALAGPRTSYMTVAEWKAKHNLPASWHLGDPYPPESDLFGQPVPPTREAGRLYWCPLCLDAGWTHTEYNVVTGEPVQLVRCRCGGPHGRDEQGEC